MAVVHPDDLPIAQQAIEEIVGEGKNGVIAEMRLRHKDGTSRYVEAHACAVRSRCGDLERIVVISRLIDDRILARRKLEEREERLQLLLDSTAGPAIYGLDLSGNCTFCNQLFLADAGATRMSAPCWGKTCTRSFTTAVPTGSITRWKIASFSGFPDGAA